MTTLRPACPVTNRAKGLLHCPLRAYRYIGATTHITGDEHRLPYLPIPLGYVRMTGRESPGCPLAMHTKAESLPLHLITLYLGYIMRHIIDHLQPYLRQAFTKDFKKALPYPVSNALPVSPGIVGSTRHGSQIILPLC